MVESTPCFCFQKLVFGRVSERTKYSILASLTRKVISDSVVVVNESEIFGIPMFA